MARFPEDFRGLLIPIAILEAASGMFKSKFDNKRLFWTFLFVEILCAVTQSVALIVAVARGRYSGYEIAAAYLTVVVDAVLLFSEAFIALKTLVDGPRAGIFTLFTSTVVAMVLGVSGLPIYLAKFQGKTLNQFKNHVLGQLLLSLPLLSGSVLLTLFTVGAIAADMKVLTIPCLLLLSVIGVSPALGIMILKTGDNLSLSFLVLSNLYPALLTFVVIAIRSVRYTNKNEKGLTSFRHSGAILHYFPDDDALSEEARKYNLSESPLNVADDDYGGVTVEDEYEVKL